MKSLVLTDTLYALIIPAFFGGAFGTFLLRQFFATIPRDLEDAALTLFTFMSYWNDLLGPVIYLSSVEKATLTVGLASLQSGAMAARYDLLMAGVGSERPADPPAPDSGTEVVRPRGYADGTEGIAVFSLRSRV